MPRPAGLTPPLNRAIDVLVGLLEDPEGRVLVNKRRAGTHMEGRWEFPGGKRRADETRFEALARELREELGIEVRAARPLTALTHAYADRDVRLDVWRVSDYTGVPCSNEGQELRWVEIDELRRIGLLEADYPIIEMLTRPLSSGRDGT